MRKGEKMGVAIAGLGGYAKSQLFDCFRQTENCYLAGLITSSPAKADIWKTTFNIPENNVYSYDDFESISSNEDIDIVYITLPNHLHPEFTIKALQAGKHVVCEKPLANTVQECDNMLKVAEQTGRLLAMDYRLHYDPYHRYIMQIVAEKKYGNITRIDTAFSFEPGKGEWRLDKQFAGGGPLMDIGIYCVQAVCYLTGNVPVSVSAKANRANDSAKFKGIEASIDFELHMPGNVTGYCHSSYLETESFLEVQCESGWFRLDPAFNYNGLRFTSSDNLQISFDPLSQQAKQMDDFCESILSGSPLCVPGSMGKRDVVIMKAIYEAMETASAIFVNY